MKEIQSTNGKSVAVKHLGGHGFALILRGATGTALAAAEFHQIDAVPLAEAVLSAAGVDAVILTDLPDVEVHPDGQTRVGELRWIDDEWDDRKDVLMRRARVFAAAARYAESRPDPQVEKLAGLLAKSHGAADSLAYYRDQARALIEAGVTVP